MGRAIIGGVITSTLLTLVVVPVLYSYLVREKKAAGAAAALGGPVLPEGDAGRPRLSLAAGWRQVGISRPQAGARRGARPAAAGAAAAAADAAACCWR